jgi:hypothetical protein
MLAPKIDACEAAGTDAMGNDTCLPCEAGFFVIDATHRWAS